MMKDKIAAICLAAGQGKRMQSSVQKQHGCTGYSAKVSLFNRG